MPALLRTRSDAKNLVSNCAELAAAIKIAPEELIYFAADPSQHYGYLEIPKGSGGVRVIRPPVKRLRAIQRALLKLLYSRFRLPSFMHGGMPGKSIMTHAGSHVDRRMVATLDVKNFFPSMLRHHVDPVIAAAGIVDEAAEYALSLVLLDGSLAQGSPTSCLLANLGFYNEDAGFLRLCRRRGLAYGRYVDDIAISGDVEFEELRGPFEQLIRAGGFEVASEKVLFQPASQRQIVTGLVVNDRLRPTREFITELKHAIRLCIQLGPEIPARCEGISVRALRMRLQGRLQHLRQCDPKAGRRLRGMLCGIRWSPSRI